MSGRLTTDAMACMTVMSVAYFRRRTSYDVRLPRLRSWLPRFIIVTLVVDLRVVGLLPGYVGGLQLPPSHHRCFHV
ncbi:hypothetical protein EDB89DRAFT_1975692 [Lactarius sanguifluus]|nr:hypothetical protein EDB89DRAFT_1975692 [Lactarius sanguifluus]